MGEESTLALIVVAAAPTMQIGIRELSAVALAIVIVGWVAWHRYGRP